MRGEIDKYSNIEVHVNKNQVDGLPDNAIKGTITDGNGKYMGSSLYVNDEENKGTPGFRVSRTSFNLGICMASWVCNELKKRGVVSLGYNTPAGKVTVYLDSPENKQ